MDLQIPKGTRDFLPEDKIIRDRIVSLLKETFELYGYNPLETPALENFETLASKYAGGAEILKETYKLEDNAQRKLGLRYDLTVPFARVIAMNPEIKKPFKRYQIDRVWRDGPIKLGRYREFWQCDVDVVGISSVLAEAELFSLAQEFFKKLGMDVTITINNRKLMNAMLKFAGVPAEKQDETILSVDKLKKIGPDGVRKELEEKGLADDVIAKVLSVTGLAEDSNEKTLDKLDDILEDKEGIQELRDVLAYSKEFGVKNLVLDISLARGLAYYTGTVLEVFLNSGKISSSLAAGGRFDRMIGNFIGSDKPVPAVGMSFGLDVLTDAIKLENAMETKKSVVQVYIVPIKTTSECIKMLSTLRQSGISCDIDFNSRNVTKNLEYVNKLEIPYALIVGENELKENKFVLRDMKTGKEKKLALKDVAKEIAK